MAAGSLDPPLHVDWIEAGDLPGHAGRLGLTFLPGKQGASMRYPGRVYRRDLVRDLSTLRDGGIRYLMLLVEDGELERWGDPEIVARAMELEIAVDRWPLRDGTAPTTHTEMDRMLDALEAARGAGDVAVACMGGVGRTGTVAACALVRAGWTAEAAIARVRAIRHPTAVETSEQMTFVRAYEGHVGDQSRASDKVTP